MRKCDTWAALLGRSGSVLAQAAPNLPEEHSLLKQTALAQRFASLGLNLRCGSGPQTVPSLPSEHLAHSFRVRVHVMPISIASRALEASFLDPPIFCTHLAKGNVP